MVISICRSIDITTCFILFADTLNKCDHNQHKLLLHWEEIISGELLTRFLSQYKRQQISPFGYKQSKPHQNQINGSKVIPRIVSGFRPYDRGNNQWTLIPQYIKVTLFTSLKSKVLFRSIRIYTFAIICRQNFCNNWANWCVSPTKP